MTTLQRKSTTAAPRKEVLGKLVTGLLVAQTARLPGRIGRPASEAKRRAECKSALPTAKGVILVSEAFTEINAGLVIVLASGHDPPVPHSVLADPDLDPDEAVGAVVKAYHMHVETYLAY